MSDNRAYMRRLSACDELLKVAVEEISVKMRDTPRIRKSSKLARAIEDVEHVRSALLSIGYELAINQ